MSLSYRRMGGRSRSGHGGSAILLRRVATTLHAIAAAASFAPDANGQLVADRDPPGFESKEGATWALKGLKEDVPSKENSPRPNLTAPSYAEAEARRAVDEKQRVVLATKRELEALKSQFAQAESVIARADRELETLAIRQAKLEAERKSIESRPKRTPRRFVREWQRLSVSFRRLTRDRTDGERR
jgi:hypothetical protein